MWRIDLCPRPLAINLLVSCGDYSGEIRMSGRDGSKDDSWKTLKALERKVWYGRVGVYKVIRLTAMKGRGEAEIICSPPVARS